MSQQNSRNNYFITLNLKQKYLTELKVILYLDTKVIHPLEGAESSYSKFLAAFNNIY